MLEPILLITAGCAITGMSMGLNYLWAIKEELWRIIVLLEDLKVCIAHIDRSEGNEKWYNQGEEWKHGEDLFGRDDD